MTDFTKQSTVDNILHRWTLADSFRQILRGPASDDFDDSFATLLSDAATILDTQAATIRRLVDGVKAARVQLQKEDTGFETWVALGELLVDLGFEEETVSEPTPIAAAGEDVEF